MTRLGANSSKSKIWARQNVEYRNQLSVRGRGKISSKFQMNLFCSCDARWKMDRFEPEWFNQRLCHSTVQQLWVEQPQKLCFGHSPSEPSVTGFMCCGTNNPGIACIHLPTWWLQNGERSIPTVPGRRDGQALAESLKSNGSLEQLYLNSNKIADRGAEAPAAECLPAGVGGWASRHTKIAGQHGWLFLAVGCWEFRSRPWPAGWSRTEVWRPFISAFQNPVCGELGSTPAPWAVRPDFVRKGDELGTGTQGWDCIQYYKLYSIISVHWSLDDKNCCFCMFLYSKFELNTWFCHVLPSRSI